MSEPKSLVPVETEEQAAILPPEELALHSDIFQRLVRGSDDVPGMVAYGIYQIRKREWIQEHRKQYKCYPTLEDVRKYSFGWRNSSLDALRQEAEADMVRFAETIIQTQFDEMTKTAFNTKTQSEIEELKKLAQGANEELKRATQTASDELKKITQECHDELKSITKSGNDDLKTLVRHNGSYKHHIVGHIVGFFALVVIAAVVLYALGHEPTISSVVDWVKSKF